MAEDTSHTQLSAELTAFVDGLAGEDVSIGEVLDAIADRGFGLILLILALPAALSDVGVFGGNMIIMISGLLNYYTIKL